MPRHIQGPDGKLHLFPDDATDDEISAALDRRATPKRTWTDTAVDALPAIGGAIGGTVGGIGGTAFGMGVGGVPGAIGGAALGGGAGEAARQLTNRWRGVASPDTSLDAAKAIGAEGAIQGASQAVGAGIGAGLSAGARAVAPALMQSALKPGIKATLSAVRSGKVPPVVNTLLEEGVNVTPGGISKLNDVIAATNADITKAIDGMSGKINPLKVASRLNDPARRFATQVNPQADLSAISQVGENFLEAHGAQDLAPRAAQALKEGTYSALKEKAYGEVKTAAIEGEKALARGLKEELAKEAEKSGINLNALNAREGNAIAAREAIAKRVALVGNRDPAGLAWLAHSPTTFIMAVMERSPAVKSMLARGLWQSASRASGMPVEALKFAIGAIASSAYQADQEPPQ